VKGLAELQVLVLDAQATSADPARGALIEIGWARLAAGEEREPPAAEVAAHIVAPPPGAAVPPAVARLTGLGRAELARGITPALAWERLMIACASGAPPLGPSPTVIHYARFEEPFLRALHRRYSAGPFPLDLVCTHAIACRLLPELPRRTLRALAGYFGAAVPPLRRSADHVVATAVVWRHLVKLLAEREGVVDLAALRNWLAQPACRSPRRYPLPRELRRSLPDRPGVYRLLRAGGAVLYVGKAASLRQRVSGHFHAGAGERALEMLTQARDVSCTETETTLEAALLEADEIKQLSPPFNVALAAVGRAVWFATADLCHLQQEPDRDHVVGPLASAACFEALSALRAALAIVPPASASRILRARAVGVESPYAPSSDCFAAGLARFEQEHGPVSSVQAVLRVGARLWARRHTEAASQPGPNDVPADEPRATRRAAWDSERVTRALEETVLRAAHAVRRARWLARLSECSLAWSEPGVDRRRLLVLRGGAVVERADLLPGLPVPVPPGHTRAPAERRAAFDVATFDRLRVLTTELRALAANAARIEVRLGPHVRLSGQRLRAVLRWV
jgi:DNA polymerase-3 subunit epsilon